MGDGIYAALSGAKACADHLEIVANNLANTRTTAFKAERTSFSEVLRSGLDRSYSSLAETSPDLSTGSMRHTGNPLDLALDGHGFFVVQTPAGELLTRDGGFTVDNRGRLVTKDGYQVMGEGGAITMGPGRVVVAPDGTVTLSKIVVGKLKVVVPEAGTKLSRAGNNLFSVPEGTSLVQADCSVKQGYLETSNVQATKALTDLIGIQRTFELLLKSMQEFKEKDSQLATQVRR